MVPEGDYLPRVIGSLRISPVVVLDDSFKQSERFVSGLYVLDVSPALITTLPLVVETQGVHIGPVAYLDDYIRSFIQRVVCDPAQVIVRNGWFRLDVRDNHVDST